jgi:hypothetical protein
MELSKVTFQIAFSTFAFELQHYINNGYLTYKKYGNNLAEIKVIKRAFYSDLVHKILEVNLLHFEKSYNFWSLWNRCFYNSRNQFLNQVEPVF